MSRSYIAATAEGRAENRLAVLSTAVVVSLLDKVVVEYGYFDNQSHDSPLVTPDAYIPAETPETENIVCFNLYGSTSNLLTKAKLERPPRISKAKRLSRIGHATLRVLEEYKHEAEVLTIRSPGKDADASTPGWLVTDQTGQPLSAELLYGVIVDLEEYYRSLKSGNTPRDREKIGSPTTATPLLNLNFPAPAGGEPASGPRPSSLTLYG